MTTLTKKQIEMLNDDNRRYYFKLLDAVKHKPEDVSLKEWVKYNLWVRDEIKRISSRLDASRPVRGNKAFNNLADKHNRQDKTNQSLSLKAKSGRTSSIAKLDKTADDILKNTKKMIESAEKSKCSCHGIYSWFDVSNLKTRLQAQKECLSLTPPNSLLWKKLKESIALLEEVLK